MVKHRFVLPLAVVGILAFAIGCGSHGSAVDTRSSTAETALNSATKAEFIFSAGTICVNEKKGTGWRGAAYRKEHVSEGLPKAVLARNTKTAVLLETAEAEVDGIRQLRRPPDDEEEIKAVLNAMQGDVLEVKQHHVETAEAALKYLSRANGMLRAYGLGICARNDSE